MVRKNYTHEFRRWAVELYESTLRAALEGIAAAPGRAVRAAADAARIRVLQ